MFGVSSIFFLDLKGRVLITRHYRGNLKQEAFDKFNIKILEFDENTSVPIIKDENLYYFHRRHNNIIILIISENNVNSVMIFTYIDILIQNLTQYLKSLEEESVRDNFVLIYELLDEMMDNGYPQTTEFKILSEFIKTESFTLKTNDEFRISNTLTNAVSWRSPGIKYYNNEIFLDVYEKLNMLISSKGQVIKSEILGQIKAKCYLSGMPECQLGLNDKAFYELQNLKNQAQQKTVQLNDIKFHQCVRLSKFENQRVISFIPPDKDFELISYRLETPIKPLFSVDVTTDVQQNKIEYYAKAKANFKKNCCASEVFINIPIPCDASSVKFAKTNFRTESLKYKPEDECIQWKIENFVGGVETIMSATVYLPSVVSENRQDYKRKPVNIKFEIVFFTVSGIQVKFLKISEQSGYKGQPWVRYVTINGDYQIRTNL